MRALVVAVAVTALAAPTWAQPAKPRPAPADTDDVIGLLDVRVEGLSADAAEVFTRKIEDGLELSGLKVASRERLRAYLAGTPWNTACLLGTCLAELQRGAAVATVIEVALATSGPSYHYVITLLDTRSGQPLTQVAAKCDVCTTDEAFTEAALAVVALVNGVGDGAPIDVPVVIDPATRRARARVAHARSRTRWLGVVLLGAAAAAGAGSWYFYRDDRDALGGATAGAAGALGVAGFTSLGLSFSF
ncbi:MAG: hypothetical protein IPL61_26525 [Myxococcales bacterium]|nr:hypothetical protein [Myxococcales bacterium]